MQTRTLFALIVVALITFCASRLTGAPQDETADIDAQLRELRTERMQTLKSRLEILIKSRETGTYSLTSFVQAQNDYLLARLDLATDLDERVELHRERIEAMKLLEHRALHNQQSGIGMASETLSASAARMQAEIDMLLEMR